MKSISVSAVALTLSACFMLPHSHASEADCKLAAQPIITTTAPVYRRSVHHSISKVWQQVFGKDYLATHSFVPANSYCDEYNDITHYRPHFALVPAHWLQELVNNYGYIPLFRTDSTLSAVVLSLKSAPLESLAELKDKTIVMPPKVSTTSFIFIDHMGRNHPDLLTARQLTETDWGDEPIINLLKGKADAAIFSKSAFDRVAEGVRNKLTAIEIRSDFPKIVAIANPCTTIEARLDFVKMQKAILENKAALSLYKQFDIEDLREFTEAEKEGLISASKSIPPISLQCP